MKKKLYAFFKEWNDNPKELVRNLLIVLAIVTLLGVLTSFMGV